MEMMWMYGLGGGGIGLLMAGLALAMIWVAASRPERISSVGQFRVASLLLSTCVVLPAVGMLMSADASSRTMSNSTMPGYTYLLTMQLLGIAVALALAVNSVLPRSGA